MPRGRKAKPVQFTMDKIEMSAVLHALKLSIDKAQYDDSKVTEDFNLHPRSYSELAILMSLFVRVAQRYKDKYVKEQS